MATIPMLENFKNYECWSVKMRTLLLSLDLWDTVKNGYNDEEDLEATSSLTDKEKQQRDAAALSQIQQGVSDSIFRSIMGYEKAKEAWDKLEEIFRDVDPSDYTVVPLDLRKVGDTHLIVAALVATVTFTAGFTVPGGFNGNDGPNQGMAILTREAAFKAFLVTDAIALTFSISAVLIYVLSALSTNERKLFRRMIVAGGLTLYAVAAMLLAFATGTYAVLAHSSSLAISVCVLSLLPIFFYLYCVYKTISKRISILSCHSWPSHRPAV